MSNQFIVSNSFSDICDILLTVDRNKCLWVMKFEVCFLEKLGYYAEQA